MFFLAFVTVFTIRAVKPSPGRLPTTRVNKELSIAESCARLARKTWFRVVRRPMFDVEKLRRAAYRARTHTKNTLTRSSQSISPYIYASEKPKSPMAHRRSQKFGLRTVSSATGT